MATTLAGLLGWMDVKGADTLYLGEGLRPMLKVQGSVKELDSALLAERDMEVCIRRFTPDDVWARFEEKGAVEFSTSIPGKRRCRMSLFKKMEGFGAVIRLEPVILPRAEHHGMPKLFDRIAKQDSGVVLVAGPRASGKTTLLHGLVNHIN